MVFDEYLRKKDLQARKKKDKDTTIEGKRRRAQGFQAKLKQQVYLESTADVKTGTYASGIGVETTNTSMRSTKGKRRKYSLKPCTCKGLPVHYKRSSKYCLKGKDVPNVQVSKI